MKIKTARLERVAVRPDQYPKDDLPEIAFVGRSNVGKSSFINSFLNRKSLARTSSEPGKTRTVNFYRVNDDFRLVDLPGYGYAKVSKKEKASWNDMINDYISERENLLELILLVDSRHRPKEEDRLMYSWIIEEGFTGFVIASKIDKLSKKKYMLSEKEIVKDLNMESEDLVLPYSSLKKTNQDLLHDQIAVIIESHKD